MTFDPWTETWTRYADMRDGRWYPTLTELPDGRVLIVGGWDETGGEETHGDPGAAPHDGQQPGRRGLRPLHARRGPGDDGGQPAPAERAGPADAVPGPPRHRPLPAHVRAARHHGPRRTAATRCWWPARARTTRPSSTPATGSGRTSSTQPLGRPAAPLHDRSWGTAWLEPSGPDGSTRVVLLGGSDSGGAGPRPRHRPAADGAPPRCSTSTTPTSGWQLDPELDAEHRPRAHFNTVLLPDGSIFTNGGGYGRKLRHPLRRPGLPRRAARARRAAPGRPVGNEADARTYHSTSVLLPDGRVLSAGDDRDIAPEHIAAGGRTARSGARPTSSTAPARR